ncbi:DUF3017 domain-containing protein [Streptomyces sp. NPDC088400]|uniref:DUF3017 domain-containing protein n=1 Tax=Streptomyces sp. NPDC088400 TaxID=3365861 RepID=UPI0037F91C8C
MGAGTSAGDAARSRREERAAAAKGAAAESPVVGSPVPGSPVAVGAGAPEQPTVAERTTPEPAVAESAVAESAVSGTAAPVRDVPGTTVGEKGDDGAAGGTDGGSRAARPAAADGTADAGAPTDADADADANANANANVNADADGDGEAASVSDSAPDRRFSITQDTARPEGGGRAAPGEASAPARQWPLLSVLGTTALGLLVVGTHLFAEAFRVGTILIGVALIGGAVLRRVLPSVGMLAVRSRFTDMLTYGVLGVVIVLLSLMTQPDPLLEIPFLEDVVHSTVT